jgi:prepilin-type N-terminal cleavage/methylation domain-containing protein
VFQRYREIQMRRQDGETESGFTLIELLIVIVVLGILAAIVVFSLSGVSGESKAAACTSDGKSVEIAADAYQASNGSFPTDINSLTNGTPQYLHSLPSGNGYGFALSGSQVNVLIPATATNGGVNYTGTSGCASLNS